MVHGEQCHRAQHRDHQAVKIQSRYAAHAEGIEQPAADNGANDSEADVYENAVPRLVDYLAGDVAGATCPDRLIAFAGSALETRTIENADLAAGVLDQVPPPEATGGNGDRTAPYAEPRAMPSWFVQL